MILLIALTLAVSAGCREATPETPLSSESDSRPVVAEPAPWFRQDTLRQLQSAQITDARRSAIAEAAQRASPAVVSVNVTRRQRQVVRSSFFDFFAMPREYERLVQGVGSGFIVSSDGLVITNQHVTEGAEQIIVTTPAGVDYPAELLGEDPLTDIAVVQIDAEDLPVIPLGTSQDLTIGEWVVAIGNPFAYLLGNSEPTVTAGVVSAVGRNLLPSGNQTGVYVGMIQTDAAINPGNSGGPLVNAIGAVVGVNSSIFTSSGGSVGIGFAIPIERALRVADELRRYGAVQRSWTGVEVVNTEDLRAWKRVGGLEVVDVAQDSPASQGGLRQGDVLVSAMGRPLRTFLDWEAVKLDVSPDDTLDVVYTRRGRERRGNLVVQSLPTTQAERISVLGDIELITITAAIQQERDLSRDFGALIYAIGDAASRATGLREGDVILQLNRSRITEAEEVEEILRRAAGRNAIRVYFERSGRVRITDFYVR